MSCPTTQAAAGWNGRQGQAEVSYEAQGGGGGGGAWGGGGTQQQQQQQQQGRGGGRQQAQRGRGGRQGGPQSEPQRPVRTHADVVKELEKTREKGPLDLDGEGPLCSCLSPRNSKQQQQPSHSRNIMHRITSRSSVPCR